MARRRAVEAQDKALSPEALPLMYKSMVPLVPERHGKLKLRPVRDYALASRLNAIPLTVDEFARAMRDYPIVFTSADPTTPLALVGFENGRNEFVDTDGNWREGAYVPAYLRRFPFHFIKETADAERHILCADLSSTQFSETEGEPLFDEGGKPAAPIARALDFCQRYGAAQERTRATMAQAQELGLVGPSSVSISTGETKRKVEGFSIIAEEKLRALADDKLADLARRGVLTLFAAHQLSLANFSSFGVE